MTVIALVRVALGARRFAAFLVGGVFGLTLSWSGMTDPDVLRDGLLFRDAYLMLFFASALVTAFVGLRVLRVLRPRAVLTGEPVSWTRSRPQRRHVVGSVLFGIGWAIADVVPGPDRRAARPGHPVGARDGAPGLVLGAALAFNAP